MDPAKKIEALKAKDRIYREFEDYVRAVATKSLSDMSVFDRLRKLRILQDKFSMDVDDPDVGEVISSIEESGAAATTVNAYRFVLKQFCEFQELDMADSEKKMLRQKRAEDARKLTPYDLLTLQEREHILSEIQSSSLRGYLAALWDTGARPSELSRMNMADVNEDAHGFVLRVHQTKYEKRLRSVRMVDPRSIAVFSDWWRVHPAKGEPQSVLFPNRTGRRVKPSSIGKFLKRRFNEELERGEGRTKCNLHLYLYRKTRATHLLKEGILSEIEIKTRMGHQKHSNVLEQYYAILDMEDQAEAELKYLGVSVEEETGEKKIPCPNCGAPNIQGTDRCFRCRLPLTEAAVLEERKSALQEAQQSLLSDPETLDTLIERVSDAVLRRQGQRRD